MNKKFSTLMAAALLAGSFSVVAQTETELVRVTPDQLVNGAEYVIHSLDNKSVMVTGKAYAGSDATASGPVFAAPNADADSVWTLALSKGKFTLTPKSNADVPSEIFKIYKWSNTNVLYTNTDGDNTVVNFELNDDGTLSAGDDFVKVYGEGGTTGFTVGAKEDAQKFAFYIKKDAVSSENIPAISEMYAGSQENMAFYILDDDGKYIGLAASQTKAINTSTLVSKDFDEFKAIEDKKPYTWYVTEDGAIKNVYYDKYLTIKSAKITVQDTPIEASISNYILSSASTTAVVGAVVTAETQLPSALLNGFWRVDFEKNDDDTYSIDAPNGIVLYAGEQNKVVNKEGGITEGYSSDDESLKMIWTLDAVETTTKDSYELRLKNKDNKYLSVDDKYVTVEGVNWNKKEYTFTSNSGIILLKAGDKYVYVNANNELHLGLIAQATEFGLGSIQTAKITAGELLGRFGDHFTLGITYFDKDTEKDVDVTGTFEGNLRPCEVRYNAGHITYDYENIKSKRSFMLVNENGNIIGVDITDPLYGEGSWEHGYSLIEISASDYVKSLRDPKFGHKYAVWFSMEYTPGQLEEKVQVINKINLAQLEGGSGFQIGLEKQGKNFVLVADESSELLSTPKIEIKLNAGSKVVDAKTWLNKPAYYTVEVLNKSKLTTLHYGKVLGLGEQNGNVTWVAPENVDLTKPEGQFAINYETYEFTNRENKKTKKDVINSDAFYKIDDTTFASVYTGSNGRTYIDTLSINPITTFESYDGFRRYTAAELNANTYTVAMKNLSGDLNIIENHNDKHRLGLDADEKNATEWRIEMPWVTVKDVVNDVVDVRPDTMTVETPITYYLASANDWVTTSLDPKAKLSQGLVYAPKTALKICTYVLKNTDNGEYLYGVNTTESAGNAYYVCNPERKVGKNTIQEATRIAFKEVGDETVNLVPVYNSYQYLWTLTDDKYPEVSELFYEKYAESFGFDNTKIIAGASTESGVLKDEFLYKATDNDLFVINVAEAPTYKKLAQGDKIILSLKSNTENVLVEGPKGGLATISNREAHKDLNPTLYVDTAYVNRVGNYAYQYLLSVRPTRIDTTYQCNLPEEHGVHRADTTKGFFLVNMVDSALANQNVHNNKFMYNGEYKLDFVEAYHTNDSLFFTEEGKVVSKMEVGNGDFNIAKYAFKMVDETENEFVIETAAGYAKKYNWVIDNKGNWHWTVASVESKPGYLRWVNDNLVVTDDIDKAAIFTMEASDKEATANENIAAGNVVVAGVNGAVVVKGAEGKNVIVSTILGKVVANETVSSDNATIAAPQGVVVVSVDGESFKVVVK